jgi:hypothetical protein
MYFKNISVLFIDVPYDEICFNKEESLRQIESLALSKKSSEFAFCWTESKDLPPKS